MTHRSWIGIFLSCLLVALLSSIAGMISVSHYVLAPDYELSTDDPTLVAEEKAFGLRNTKCDVMIYGDSTAMTGIDPRIIEADAGLRTCNISVTWPIISLLGTMPLDEALAHNPPPRYVVFQLAPHAFFGRGNWDDPLVANSGPISMLLRQRPGLKTDWTLALHPGPTAHFFGNVLLDQHPRNAAQRAQILARDSQFHKLYDSRLQDFARNGGLLSVALPAQTHCLASPNLLSGPLDTKWPEELRQRYQKPGTQVLVVVAPVPDCDPQLDFYRKRLAPYVDRNVVSLPIDDFVEGDRHMTLKGSTEESHLLAQFLKYRDSPTR